MKKIKGWKVFHKDLTCMGFQYKIGKVFKHKGKIKLCNDGFHFHKKLKDLFNYYSFNMEMFCVCEIEALGKIIDGDDKSVTDKLKIICKLSTTEVLNLINSGTCNSGSYNSGSYNSGDKNSGDFNSGSYNSGSYNSGIRNSGDKNYGAFNSGNFNSGDVNSGDKNSGDFNSGDFNSGDFNSGDKNSGIRNFGDKNSGDKNSGDFNSGDFNSGSYNSGSYNSGNFNTIIPKKILIFNKLCDREVWENCYKPNFLTFNLNIWVYQYNMTKQEKEKFKWYETTGGYLKKLSYKKAFQKSWNEANKKDRIRIKDLPNFDANIFYEISGIDLR